MDAPFALGAPVKQKVQPIVGTVVNVNYVPATQSFDYLVEYTDEAAAVSSRWFHASEIEVTGDPA